MFWFFRRVYCLDAEFLQLVLERLAESFVNYHLCRWLYDQQAMYLLILAVHGLDLWKN